MVGFEELTTALKSTFSIVCLGDVRFWQLERSYIEDISYLYCATSSITVSATPDVEVFSWLAAPLLEIPDSSSPNLNYYAFSNAGFSNPHSAPSTVT